MIVISGALVVVALILLVIGLASGSLAFVYASIGVSVLSFVALLVGVLQRRREGAPSVAAEATTTGTASGVDAAEAIVAPVRRASAPSATGGLTGSVLVVAGRPRYHVAGCRYLTGKSSESVEVGSALEQGFTACGVCKPDAALEAGTADSASSSTAALETVPSSARAASARAALADAPSTSSADLPAAPPVRTAARTATKAVKVAKAPARKATKATKSAAKPVKSAAKAPAKAAKKAAPKPAAKKTTKAPAKAPAKKAPAKAPAKKAPAKKAPAKKAPAKKAPAKKAAAKKAGKR